MTFCGDLLFVPSGIHHHLFENLRRMGHHCHGLTHLSWAERKIFYRVLGKKFCGLFIYPGQVRQVVAVSAPGDRGSAPAGSAETGGCASNCLSESGLTTGCRQAAGSRRCARQTGQHCSSQNQSRKKKRIITGKVM